MVKSNTPIATNNTNNNNVNGGNTMTNTTITRSEPVAFNLDDVVLHYVNLGNPVTPTYDGQRDNPQWSVQIRGLNDETVEDMKEMGFHMTQQDTGEWAFTMKQYTQNSRGISRDVKVYNLEGGLMDLEERQTIGMGTRAAVSGYMYAYQTNDGRQGVSVRLTDVLVVEKQERTAMTDEQNFMKKFGALADKFKGSQESAEVLEDI